MNLALTVPDRYDSTGQDLTLTGHGHDDDGYGVNQVDKRQSKSCLVLSRFVSCVIASATLQYSTVQYSYRNEAASFKVQGNGKNEREQKSKEKNKKRETETRFTNTTNNTIQ